MRFYTLCLLGCTIISANLSSQEVCFVPITDAHILSIEESFEYIWMGTLEDGLLRYNKSTGDITEFNVSNTDILSNKVKSVFRYGGQVIFSGDSGIYGFEGINVVELTDTIGGEIGGTADGHMIVAGNQDYYEFDDGTTVVYEKDLMEEANFSCSLCETTTDLIRTSSGEIWLSHFSFYEFDILQFDGDTWTLHDINTSGGVLPIESWTPHNRIMAYDDKIYASSIGQIFIYDNGEWINTSDGGPFILTPDMETISTAITDLEKDVEVGYWVGSTHNTMNEDAGKLSYFDGEHWGIFDLPAEANTDITRIYSSYIEEGFLYVGTSSGLYIIEEACLGVNGIAELQNNQMIVYPNPSNGELRFEESITSEILIMNMNGQIVKSYSEGIRNSIMIDYLATGEYLINFKVDEKDITSKFIVLN